MTRISFLPLIFIAIACVGVMAATRRSCGGNTRRRTGRNVAIVTGIICAAFAACFVGLFSARSVVSSGNRTVSITAPTPPLVVSAGASSLVLGPGASPEQAGMLADLYPSENAAIAQVVGQIVQQLHHRRVSENSPASVALIWSGSAPQDSAAMRRAMGWLNEAVRHELPQAALHGPEKIDPATASAVVTDVTIELSELDVVEPSSETIDGFELSAPRSGRVSVAALGNGGATLASASTKFVEKPWAADWSSYASQSRDSAKRELRVESMGLFSDPDQARQSAASVAANKLFEAVKQQMAAGASYSAFSRVKVTDDWIKGQLGASLGGDGSLIREDFPQRYSRSIAGVSTDMWRDSLLIDVSPAKIQHLAATYNATASEQIGSTATQFGSIAGIAVVIVLAYAFLNAATRGYFVWRLRAAALFIVIVAALVVFAMM